MEIQINKKCTCKSSTGSTHVECCNICGLPLQKEQWHFILSDNDISAVEPEISTGWTGEGELVKKEVSHNETVLYINYLDEQIVVLIPHDFDDFVKVGDDLEITIKVK